MSMKTRLALKKWAIAALTGPWLAACSSTAPVATPPVAQAPQYGVQSLQELPDPHAALVERLQLTRSQIRAIKNALVNAVHISQPMLEMLRPWLSEAEVNEVALNSVLGTLMTMDAAQDTQFMHELREILTPTQRALFADALLQFPDIHSGAMAGLTAELTTATAERLALTTDQSDQFNQFTGDFLNFWDAYQMAYMKAMAEHLKNGDRSQLQATMESLNRLYETNSAAAFLGGLDQAQRQKVLAGIDDMRAQMVRCFTRWTQRTPRRITVLN
jgi:uncharacterized membrane protein